MFLSKYQRNMGKGFPNLDYKYPLDEKILKSISFEKNIAIKMMDRIDLNRYSFNFSDRQSFFTIC